MFINPRFIVNVWISQSSATSWDVNVRDANDRKYVIKSFASEQEALDFYEDYITNIKEALL